MAERQVRAGFFVMRSIHHAGNTEATERPGGRRRPTWSVVALVVLILPWLAVTAAATLLRSDTLVPHAAGRVVGHVATTDAALDELADDLADQLSSLAPAEVEAAGGTTQTRETLRGAIDDAAVAAAATRIGEALGRGMLDGSDPNAERPADAGAAPPILDDLAGAVGPPLASALREHRAALTAPISVGAPNQRPGPVTDGDTAVQGTRDEPTSWGGLRRAFVPLTVAALALTVVVVLAARAARPPRWLGAGVVGAWLLVAVVADLAADRDSVGAMVLAPVLWAGWPAAVVLALIAWLLCRPAPTASTTPTMAG